MPKIEMIRTGVPGLDSVLGGGLPRGSFNVIAGGPGAGKTTLTQHILFSNATEERPALFCTVVGEPPVKMLRYQQQFDFFEVEKVGRSVHFMNVSDEVLEGNLAGVLESIVQEVERLEPAFVAVDSFRSVTRMFEGAEESGRERFQSFVQRLSNIMTRWEATSFLLGEFEERETPSNPLFTVADGIFWLHQVPEGDTRVRKITVIKIRGSEELAGQHVYRIGSGGIRVYPRSLEVITRGRRAEESERVSSGVEGLDEMMSGGFVRGDAIIVSGPSGTGKSVLGMQFAGAGLDADEHVVVATFEESLQKYLDRAALLGHDLRTAADEGRLGLTHRGPLDLSVDETFEKIRDLVEDVGAARVVVDSLSGLQVAASGARAERLRESMARMVDTLTEAGVTVLMTAQLHQRLDVLSFTPHDTSFLADDVILQRYVEAGGQLETVMSVVKMRRSGHSRSFHRYGITEKGIVVGEALTNFHGILTGVPEIKGEEPHSATGRGEEDERRTGGTDGEGRKGPGAAPGDDR